MFISPFFAPVVILLVSIPLFLKLVPRNPLFGLRTPATLSSDKKWYAANRKLGAGGIIGSGIWLVLVVALTKSGVSPGYITLFGLIVTIACASIASSMATNSD